MEMNNKHYDVFINYRRNPGRDFARTLQQSFKSRGYSVFFDYDSLQDGEFNKEIYTAIENCDVFIASYSKGSLDRCKNDGDWVRIEIEHALKHGKKVIPVAPTEVYVSWKFPQNLPHSLAVLPTIEITEIHTGKYFEDSIDHCAKERFPKGLVRETTKPTDADVKEAERLFHEGRKHEDGAYERCDINKVFEFYKAAAEKGHPDAQFEVGTAYNEGWGGRVRDLGFAINWWEKAAGGGSPDAMYALAELYKSGDGLGKDMAQSEKLVKRAFSLWKVRADAGDSRAQRRLAYCYKDGVGTKRDRRLASIWLTKAAENNDVWALIEVGFCQAGDDYGEDIERESWRKKAWDVLSTLARKGNPWCQYELSYFYSGQYGEEMKDSAEAMKWLGKAADQGVSGAMWELGARYLKGEDVPVDFDKAYMFLSRAVQNGNRCALYEYGQCLLLGLAGYDEEDTNTKAIASLEECAKHYDAEECSGIAGGEESYNLLERFRERSLRSGEAAALALARVECWAKLYEAHEENGHPDVAADDRRAAINVLSSSSLPFKDEDAAYASQILCEYACGLGKKQAEEAVKACNSALRLIGDQEEARVMKGHALFLLALAYRNLKKFSLSLETCQEALSICASGGVDNVQDSIRMKCSFLLGTLQMDLGKYADAFQPYREALSLRLKLEKDTSFYRWEYLPESEARKLTIAGINLRLAQCASKVGNKPLAHNYALTALKESSRYPSDNDYGQLIRRCEEFQKQVRPFNYQDISELGDFGRVLVKIGWYDDYKFCDVMAFDDDMYLPLLLLPKDRDYRPVQFKNGDMPQVTATEECVDDELLYPELLVQLAGKSLDALFPKRRESKLRRRCLIVCPTSTVDALRRIWREWLEYWRKNEVVFCSYEELNAELGKCFNIGASNANSSEDVRYEVWVEGISYDSWLMNTRIMGEALKAMKSRSRDFEGWRAYTICGWKYGRRVGNVNRDAQGVLESNLTREEAFASRKILVQWGFLASARPMVDQ